MAYGPSYRPEIFRTLLGKATKSATIGFVDTEIRLAVQQLHDSPGRVMLVTAGAGTRALAWLLGVAGASRTLLEALIPYDESSFDDFLGRKPKQYVAAKTARLLAGRAISRANQLYDGPEPVIGLACTATIVTDRPKRGQHRARIATWTNDRIVHHSLELNKGVRNRDGEEEVVSRLILSSLIDAFGHHLEIPSLAIEGDEHKSETIDLRGAVEALHRGQVDFIGLRADGRLKPTTRPKLLLSGAFNPLHGGHLGLAAAAHQIIGHEVIFELAAVNADKPSITLQETLQRLVQFAGRYTVLASNAPTFLAKARLFPEAIFVVGYDTAERILHPRFYSHDVEILQEALTEIRAQGCRFLVAGRSDESGTFHDAAELVVPDGFKDLFQPISPKLFRDDLSSTQLRRAGEIASSRQSA